MTKLPQPQRGADLHDYLVIVRDFIHRERITSVEGGLLRASANGKTISLPKSRARKSQLAGEKSHPWKVTVSGEDEVAVAAGFVVCSIAKASVGAGSRMDPIVYVPVGYAGGVVEVTEPGYIYAKLSTPPQGGAATEAVSSVNVGADDLTLHVRQPESVSVVFSIDAPGVFNPDDDSVSYPIAKIDYDDGKITVEAQYLIHNPTHDMGYLRIST